MRTILGIFVFLMMTVLANASPITAPAFKQDQHVYVVPKGFDPPFIGGQAGINELEAAAKKLHFPFYIVLVQEIPGSTAESVGNALNGLATDWQNQGTGFDTSVSQVFLLAYSAKTANLLAGSKFERDLGFVQEKHLPYMNIFKTSMQGKRKDPKGGLIAMMPAIDEYLFDQTDTTRIAERAEQARKAAEAQLLQNARSMLDNQIARLSDLLEEKSYLPSDVSGYEASLRKAREVRQKDIPADMQSMATSAKSSADTLSKYVDQKKSEESARQFKTFLSWLALCFTIAGLIGFVVIRLLLLVKLRKRYKNAVAPLDQQVTNAQGNFMNFFNERDDLVVMKHVMGKTKTLFDQVTAEVDSIYSAIRAMELHILRCNELAAKATFFTFAPLRKALLDLDGEFTFNTGVLNKADLFGSETKVIKVTPTTFSKDLQRRYATSIDSWKRLKAAAAIRLTAAETAFPSTNLDEMFRIADQHSIPRRWLQDHPLFGDDASDQALYSSLNSGKNEDPLTYLEKIEELKVKEAVISNHLNRLVNAVKLVTSSRFDTSPMTFGSVVEAQDNPQVTFNEARLEDDKFTGRLASRDKVEDIEEQARDVANLYRKTKEQEATLKAAVESVNHQIARVEAQQSKTIETRAVAMNESARGMKLYTNCNASKFIMDGDKYIEAANRALGKARERLSENRHLNARRNADEAVELLNKAAREFDQAVKHVKALDEQKQAFKQKLDGMSSRRAKALESIKKHGGKTDSTPDFVRPTLRGETEDYRRLLEDLEQQEAVWAAAELSAKRAYEAAELARQEALAAAQRAADAAEAEVRRSHSHSHTTWSSPSSGNDTTSSVSWDSSPTTIDTTSSVNWD